MRILVDSSIHLNPDDLPENVLEEIYNKLRISNPRKTTAEREMLWGAENLPDYIELWNMDVKGDLVLPRGFLKDLDDIFYQNDINSNFVDKCSIGQIKLFKNIPPIVLRDYQQDSAFKLWFATQGIYKAPTGSGKTRTMLEVIRQVGQKTLVICEKKDIAAQWVHSAKDLGFNPYDEINYGADLDFLVLLRQNLWSNRNILSKEWFNEWGMIVIDECHHCTADTMIDLVQRFPACYRFGCSATPDADPDLFPIVQAVLGPVVAESTPKEIGGHLVIPSVRVVKTEFEFDYRPTMRAGNTVVHNNYNDMMSSVECDFERNLLIVDLINQEAEKEKYILVVSKRISHLEEIMIKFSLRDMGPNDNNVEFSMLTGQNPNEYKDIKNAIEKSNKGYVLFSTLADEGTDIPILDRLFLTYPGRKLRGFEQAIGRIMRPHPQKKDAIVYDFRDANVSLLNSQFRNRIQNIYHKKNYKVENL